MRKQRQSTTQDAGFSFTDRVFCQCGGYIDPEALKLCDMGIRIFCLSCNRDITRDTLVSVAILARTNPEWLRKRTPEQRAAIDDFFDTDPSITPSA
jgi:hypothetical protein